MTAKDLKIEIQKVLDEVPEELLENILSYLQEVKNSNASGFADSLHIKKVLMEDRELLKKLAQ